MNLYTIKKISSDAAKQTMEEIGFDKSYINTAVEKYKFLLLKISDLTCPQATIIKQLALSIGADCAVHREVITNKVEKTDLMLGASVSQIKKIAEKLKFQTFNLQVLTD